MRTTLPAIVLSLLFISFTPAASPADTALSAKSAAAEARKTLDQNAKAHPARQTVTTKPTRRVEATLAFAVGGPKVIAKEWFLIGPMPPELPSQSGVTYKATPDAKLTAEPAGLKQPLLHWHITASDSQRKVIGVHAMYTLTLISRTLTPLNDAQPAPKVAPLPEDQRAFYTSPSALVDFETESFQSWLTSAGLRPKDSEADIDFARRAFLHIKENSTFEFKVEADRRASAVCKTLKADCGGLTCLYTAILRANSIPCRQLVGRWADSAKKDEQLYGQPWQKEHIKCDFFASDVGWIPVDISVAVDFDKKPGSLQHFGNDPGDFVTLHLDPDIIFEVPGGTKRSVRFLQEPAYWFVGQGAITGDIKRLDWQVRNLRMER